MLDSLDTLIAFSLIMLVVSLLITICVQMIAAALNWRGQNLASGLSITLKVVCPALADKAEAMVNHVLRGPMLSDSTRFGGLKLWQTASAARPHEVFDAIHRIATDRHSTGSATPEEIAEFRAQAVQLLQALGVPPSAMQKGSAIVEETKQTINDLDSTVQAAIKDLPEAQKAIVCRTLSSYGNQLTAYATHITNHAVGEIEDAATAIDEAYKKFEYWYNIAQERAQAWFTTHARIAHGLICGN